MKQSKKGHSSKNVATVGGGAKAMMPSCRDAHGAVKATPDARTAWGRDDMTGTRHGGMSQSLPRGG